MLVSWVLWTRAGDADGDDPWLVCFTSYFLWNEQLLHAGRS